MRLRCVESGHDPAQTAVLEGIRAESGREPVDVVKTLHYRPELFAAYVSSLNQCPF